ncbi:MAG: hypothetical protein RLZZ312_619 [Bacteroidota bacterium]|jgi:uncharacterized protein YutD
MSAQIDTFSEIQIDNNQLWFDEMVSNIRYDQLLLKSDLLEKQKKEVYDAMISGNHDFMHNYARKNSSAFFIKNLIDSYFIELITRKKTPNRLALELSNSKILVWAEIMNDDEDTENALILAAAKVNNDFSKYGFHLSSTIVEKDDLMDVPAHYKEVTIK